MLKPVCPICLKLLEEGGIASWTFDQKTVTTCTKCCCKVPFFLLEAIVGKTTVITKATVKEAHTLVSVMFYEGTWNQDNWQTYPTVQQIRSATYSIQNNTDNHDGMIHNPITDKWSWF